MRKILLLFVWAFLIMLGSCNKESIQIPQDEDDLLVNLKDGDIIPGQYVVLLKEGVTSVKSAKLSYPGAQDLMRTEMKKILKASKIAEREPLQVYSAAIEGFAVKLSEEEAEALGNNPGVAGIWPDKVVILKRPAPVPTPLPPQTIPPGIERVGGVATYIGTNRIWIIDTGIDLNHEDLNVDAGKTFVPRTTTADDDNGHGTHCAGIAAAKNNSVGVIGVAADAHVVPVKVLDKRGSGAYSTIMKGVDYVTNNADKDEDGIEDEDFGDAVNMSLGGSPYEPLDLAVIAMGEAGLYVSLAAGNESDDAVNHSPARASDPLLYPNAINVYAISACSSSVDDGDIWASFSNFGNAVDFCAPGVSILSLYKNNGMATMSGTSMAAPHACGVLLVTGGKPKSLGTVANDPDNPDDPIIHTTGYVEN